MCVTVRASGFFPLSINVTDSWLSIFDVLNQGDVLFLEEKIFSTFTAQYRSEINAWVFGGKLFKNKEEHFAQVDDDLFW